MSYRGQVEALTARLETVAAERDRLATKLAQISDEEGQDRYAELLERRVEELEPLVSELEAAKIQRRRLRARIGELEAELRLVGGARSLSESERPVPSRGAMLFGFVAWLVAVVWFFFSGLFVH